MGTPIWQIEGVALDSTGDMVTGSLGYYINTLAAYETTETLVYPTLAAGATVVSANTNWGQGAYATIVPASTIASVYRLGTQLVPANAQIRARLASSDGLANQATITMSIRYQLNT